MSNVPLPEPDISVPFLSEVRKVPQGDYYRADKVLPLLKQWPVLYEAAKAGHEQAFAEAQNAAAVSAEKDAEIERLRAEVAGLREALQMWLTLHDNPAGYAGKYGKALDAAIAAQQTKIDAAATAARAALAARKGEA